MEIVNKFSMSVLSRSSNEAFARSAVAAFAAVIKKIYVVMKTAIFLSIIKCSLLKRFTICKGIK